MTPQVQFVVNLRATTVTPEFRRRVRPPGYLAPPAYLTADLRALAPKLSARGQLLIADNGLYDDIARIAKQLAPQTKAVAAHLHAARTRLDRPPRSTDLDDPATKAVSELADFAGQRAAAVTPHGTRTERLALGPTALIGPEDITAALWIRLGIDGALPRTRRRELARRNAAVARAAVKIASQLPDGVTVLPVAGMVGYDSAYDAGRAFAAAGLRAAAAGFGAYMADDSWTTEVLIAGRRKPLGQNLPARYLRTALAARGFWDGWHKETASTPDTFHFLGLGAPIMIAITALAAHRSRLLTYDATSPIRDATEGFLYISKPAYLKARTWSAAQRLASADKARWRCPCAFCKAFIKQHPFDYAAGHRWWARNHGRTIKSKDLRGRAQLAAAYPLLSQPTKQSLRAAVDTARIGHNHWALEQICKELRGAADLDAAVGDVVAEYAKASQAEYYVAAVIQALAIARGTLP